jgi:hypothetical protein
MTDKEYEAVNGLVFMISNSDAIELVKAHFLGKYNNPNAHELLQEYFDVVCKLLNDHVKSK